MTPAPRSTRTAPALALGLLLAVLPACMVIQAGSVSAASSASVSAAPSATDEDARPDAGQWPERWGRRGQRIKGVIEPVDIPFDDLVGVRLGEHHQLRAAEEERAAVEKLAQGEPDVGLFRFRAEGPGSYVFIKSFQSRDAPADAPDPSPDDPSEVFRFVSGERAPDAGPAHVEIQRTWFALYDPAPGAEDRGVIALLPGMFGTPQPVIHTTVRRLRAEGWTVLRMLSHPGRFTQKARFEIEAADIEAGAARIARVFNDRTAEVAYSVEGALEHVHEQRPGLRSLPHVLLGMSGGAMALPTVHARTPDTYDAAILIAGGANFLEINLRSNYAEWIDSVELAWSGSIPGREQTEALLKSYLQHAHLDAVHTAPTLKGKPVLVLHAARDKAVPAETGERLWRLLGEPERWVFPVGHELIFAALPFQLDRMVEWLDNRLPVGGDAES
ncbi:MAG: alpha/beta hydrolase [Phycisphaerales bacterium JB059]